MPRIRTIKPDAFTSDTLSDVSVLARWTFAGLWTYCDDEGRGRDDARLIKAALFPIDDDTSLADVRQALDELAETGSICRYQASGRRFLHCPKWSDHQKVSHPTASKLPECPKDHLTCTLEDSGVAPESLGSPQESLAPERKGKEQGKGSGNARPRGSAPDRFADFWAVYPRRVDKGHAEKAFAKAIKSEEAQVVIDAAARFAAKVKNSDPKFIPHAATWLNGERWLDEERPATQVDDQGRILLPPLPRGVFEQ